MKYKLTLVRDILITVLVLFAVSGIASIMVALIAGWYDDSIGYKYGHVDDFPTWVLKFIFGVLPSLIAAIPACLIYDWLEIRRKRDQNQDVKSEARNVPLKEPYTAHMAAASDHRTQMQDVLTQLQSLSRATEMKKDGDADLRRSADREIRNLSTSGNMYAFADVLRSIVTVKEVRINKTVLTSGQLWEDESTGKLVNTLGIAYLNGKADQPLVIYTDSLGNPDRTFAESASDFISIRNQYMGE